MCFSTQNLHSFTHAFILVLVLQGNAATKLSCGGKFFILVVSCFFLILTVKEFLKSTNICQSYGKNKSGTVFFTHSVESSILTFSFYHTMLCKCSTRYVSVSHKELFR